MNTLLLIILALILLGVLPVFPHSKSWGYFPSGILLVILIVVAVMLFR